MLMQSFKDLGLLEDSEKISINSWGALLPKALSLKLKSTCGFDVDMNHRSLETVIRDSFSWDETVDVLTGKTNFMETLEALEWLGLWSGKGSTNELLSGAVPVPTSIHTPLELFAMILAHRLRYAPKERDMVVLHHEVTVRGSDPTQREEIHRSSLVAYGDSSASAMAKTVGLPVAFAALDVLDGKVSVRGVSGPNEKEVYEAVLGRLEEYGLGMVESSELAKIGPGDATIEDCLY